MGKRRFEAELIEGHKGVTVVIVPFDPEAVWSKKPMRLEGRRHGWPVRGTCEGVAFQGYVGERWGRFFVIIDRALREAAEVSVGDTLTMSVEPTETARAIAVARAQSKVTTQPKTARADVKDATSKTFWSDRPRGSRS
jgi:hypothetical protein